MAVDSPINEKPDKEENGNNGKKATEEIKKHQGMEIPDNVFFFHSPEKQLGQQPADFIYGLADFNA